MHDSNLDELRLFFFRECVVGGVRIGELCATAFVGDLTAAGSVAICGMRSLAL